MERRFYLNKFNKILFNLPINEIVKSLNIKDIPPVDNGINVNDLLKYATAFSLVSKGVSSLAHEYNSYQGNQIKRDSLDLQRMKQNNQVNLRYTRTISDPKLL